MYEAETGPLPFFPCRVHVVVKIRCRAGCEDNHGPVVCSRFPSTLMEMYF